MIAEKNLEPDHFNITEVVRMCVANWRLISIGVLVGGIAATCIALLLPQKFKAEALIQTGSALGKEIESVQTLNEKMRLASYYSQKTVSACALKPMQNDELGDDLPRELKPIVARNSSFVSISFKSNSVDISRACLNAVLLDVVGNQSVIGNPRIERAKDDLRIAKRRIEIAKTKRSQEIIQNIERLAIYQEKLKSALKFIAEFENNIANFDFKDEKFSASSLLLATLLAKQEEAKDLKLEIRDLEMKVNSELTGREDEIFNLEKQIDELEKSLATPATEPAKFAAPIFSPNFRVEPNRSIIIISGMLMGFLSSLCYIYLLRFNAIRKPVV